MKAVCPSAGVKGRFTFSCETKAELLQSMES